MQRQRRTARVSLRPAQRSRTEPFPAVHSSECAAFSSLLRAHLAAVSLLHQGLGSNASPQTPHLAPPDAPQTPFLLHPTRLKSPSRPARTYPLCPSQSFRRPSLPSARFSTLNRTPRASNPNNCDKASISRKTPTFKQITATRQLIVLFSPQPIQITLINCSHALISLQRPSCAK